MTDLDSIMPVVKARLFGESDDESLDPSIGGSQQISVEAGDQQRFRDAGAIEPPYDMAMLCKLFEHSTALRPPIDSYATNIDGFGHRLEPVYDLESDDDRESLRELVSQRRQRKIDEEDYGSDNNAVDGKPVPTDDDLERELKELGREMVREKARLETFLERCCIEYSFVKLRRLTRQDLETTGNAFWEVIRNAGGDIDQFVWMPSFTVRLMPLGGPVIVETPVRQPDLTYKTIKRRRRFRIIIQVVEGHVVYFKELGDPRTISSKSGQVYESVEKMRAEEGDHVMPATEVKHFKIETSYSAYGVPRWIGALLSVLGSRFSEEVNFTYFDNKTVPPLAILVSGGKISDSSVKRVESFIETNLKGKHNFHKILVLEAEPATGTSGSNEQSSRMKIELRPLTGAQHHDALFQKYDERNLDKTGNMFRLPRLLRGDIRDFNRSTAMAALNFAEMQVFQPEREDFDWFMNREIFSLLAVRFWKFNSRAPVTRDPVAMSEIIRNLVNANTLVPQEGRELAADVFNREFKRINQDWTKQPMAMTLAGIAGGINGVANGVGQGEHEGGEEDSTSKAARQVLMLRKLLEQAEDRAANKMIIQGLAAIDAEADDDDKVVVKIDRKTMESFFEQDDGGAAASSE